MEKQAKATGKINQDTGDRFASYEFWNFLKKTLNVNF